MTSTLAIECATEACSVALFDGGELIAGDFRMLGRGHAEALVPMIDGLPGKGRAARILVGLGPGSFTGLRIGIAAARALGLAWGAPVLGYPTLALVALGAREQAGAQPVLAATTAGHGEWFCQHYDAAGMAAGPLATLAPVAAVALLHAGEDRLVAGSQAEALVARAGTGRGLALWPDARLARALPPTLLTAVLAPIYGRTPDARLPANVP